VGGEEGERRDGVEERQRGRQGEAGRLRVGQDEVLARPQRFEAGGLGMAGDPYGRVGIGARPVVGSEQSEFHGPSVRGRS
jgi:hypothetical protein